MSRNPWVVRSAVRGPPALDDGVDRQGRVVHVLIHRRHLQPQTPHRLLDAPDQDRLRPLVEGDGVGEGPAHVDRNSHLPLLDRVLGRWPRPSLPLGPSPPPLALPTSMAGQELAQPGLPDRARRGHGLGLGLPDPSGSRLTTPSPAASFACPWLRPRSSSSRRSMGSSGWASHPPPRLPRQPLQGAALGLKPQSASTVPPPPPPDRTWRSPSDAQSRPQQGPDHGRGMKVLTRSSCCRSTSPRRGSRWGRAPGCRDRLRGCCGPPRPAWRVLWRPAAASRGVPPPSPWPCRRPLPARSAANAKALSGVSRGRP